MLATIPAQALGAWTSLATLTGERSGDQFGDKLAMNADGTVLAVGGPRYRTGQGLVRVHVLSAGTWSVQEATIYDDTGNNCNGAGTCARLGESVAISADGSILAAGAPSHGNGKVKVWQYSSGSWTRLGADIVGETSGDLFGTSVALSADGTVLAAGGYMNDNGGGTDAGHVRVFGYDGSAWQQRGLDLDGSAATEYLGISVSLSSDGSVMAAGAYSDPSTTGKVRVWEYGAGGWSRKGSDIAGTEAGGRFGYAVALTCDGSLLAIGGRMEGAGNEGMLAMYTYTAGNWALRDVKCPRRLKLILTPPLAPCTPT